MNALRLGGVMVALMFVQAGCLSSAADRPAEPQVVSAAPGEVYIKAGQSAHFAYQGYRIDVSYLSAYPEHRVKVRVDGAEKDIVVNITAPPRGIYWKEHNLSFSLKPVVWELRDGKMVPVYEKTWNTSVLYFRVVFRASRMP